MIVLFTVALQWRVGLPNRNFQVMKSCLHEIPFAWSENCEDIAGKVHGKVYEERGKLVSMAFSEEE